MELIFKNTTLTAYGEESGVGSRYRSNSQFGNCIRPGMHDGSLDRSRSCGVGWEGSDLRKGPMICSDLTMRPRGMRWGRLTRAAESSIRGQAGTKAAPGDEGGQDPTGAELDLISTGIFCLSPGNFYFPPVQGQPAIQKRTSPEGKDRGDF